MDRTTVKLLKPGRIQLGDVFEHPYLLISIFAIALSFIIFVLYKYYIISTSVNLQNGYTFFSKNPVLDPPVFTERLGDGAECKARCEADPLCEGITFDTNNFMCIGSKNGVMIPATAEYSAWIKPAVAIDPYLTKTIITSYANSPVSVKSSDIAEPSIIGQMTFSMWLNITDWYNNFQYWKHVAHKGTNILDNSINCQQWSDVCNLLPDQCIGIWLAPYSNNLRIAVSTELEITASMKLHETGHTNSSIAPLYLDANVMSCNTQTKTCYLTDSNINIKPGVGDASVTFSKSIEYIDIQNIPINRFYHIAVAFDGKMMNIYTNGGLYISKQLNGVPIFNHGAMYVKYDRSFSGQVLELAYVPLLTTSSDISKFYNARPPGKLV